MPQIRIKYFTDAMERLTYIDGKSDWIDLRASEEVTLKAGEFCLIPLGVAMELPEGYEAHVVPRSSTFKNYGIIQTNSCGIIDGTYCGDDDMWRMPVYAVRDTVIHVNDRICQFRIFENEPRQQKPRRIRKHRQTVMRSSKCLLFDGKPVGLTKE